MLSLPLIKRLGDDSKNSRRAQEHTGPQAVQPHRPVMLPTCFEQGLCLSMAGTCS